MCGIYCCVHETKTDAKHASGVQGMCENFLNRRGPDQNSSLTAQLNNWWSINLTASVLWTQGNDLCEQPVHHCGSVLCWNGDIFRGPLAEEADMNKESDTKILFNRLIMGSPCNVLSEVQGPFSFVYLNKKDETLWIGRDRLGRHSLLWGIDKGTNSLIVTSVGHRNLTYLKEVPAIGLFQIHFPAAGSLSMTLHPWSEHMRSPADEFPITTCISAAPITAISMDDEALAREPTEADLAHFHQFQSNTPIYHLMETLLNTNNFRKNVDILYGFLEHAVELRVKTVPPFCQKCVIQRLKGSFEVCLHSRIAVLFSGGLDSAILAALVNKFVPSNQCIDLLNVAFERQRKVSKDSQVGGKNIQHKKESKMLKQDVNHSSNLFDVPDRITGRKSLEELRELFPERTWNFVEINVSQEELKENRSNHISHLIHPLNTILDESLGCALWFATRGKGVLYETEEEYTSSARVVILGMGADEQFGGYTRHRNSLKNRGWKGLTGELQEDMERIPSRNLGRDNRIASDLGRQPRLPYLDEAVIQFSKSLQTWEKCYPTKEYPCGTGDKLLLRLVAWKIGLRRAAVLPKRAMQFGSRIANGSENAAHVSNRL